MELNEYQKQAMTTCTESSHNFAYMMLNLVGEVGEFASKVAKSVRKEHLSINSNDFEEHDIAECTELERGLRLEAGDILWQLSGLCSVMGWNLEDIAKANLDKLKSRQERNKIVGDGDYRLKLQTN